MNRDLNKDFIDIVLQALFLLNPRKQMNMNERIKQSE